MGAMLADLEASGFILLIVLVSGATMAALVARAVESGASALPVAALSGTIFGAVVALVIKIYIGG